MLFTLFHDVEKNYLKGKKNWCSRIPYVKVNFREMQIDGIFYDYNIQSVPKFNVKPKANGSDICNQENINNFFNVYFKSESHLRVIEKN